MNVKVDVGDGWGAAVGEHAGLATVDEAARSRGSAEATEEERKGDEQLLRPPSPDTLAASSAATVEMWRSAQRSLREGRDGTNQSEHRKYRSSQCAQITSAVAVTAFPPTFRTNVPDPTSLEHTSHTSTPCLTAPSRDPAALFFVPSFPFPFPVTSSALTKPETILPTPAGSGRLSLVHGSVPRYASVAPESIVSYRASSAIGSSLAAAAFCDARVAARGLQERQWKV